MERGPVIKVSPRAGGRRRDNFAKVRLQLDLRISSCESGGVRVPFRGLAGVLCECTTSVIIHQGQLSSRCVEPPHISVLSAAVILLMLM